MGTSNLWRYLMSDQANPADEAARALQDVEQRRGQARASMYESRWVSIVFGVALFAQLAAPDFFGESVRTWTSWVVLGLLAAYMVLLRTRRGSELLGRHTRVRKSEMSPRFAFFARLAIVLALVAGFAFTLFGDRQLFPYAGTALGALVGGGLIFFGQTWQKGFNSLATRGHRVDGGAPHGSR